MIVCQIANSRISLAAAIVMHRSGANSKAPILSEAAFGSSGLSSSSKARQNRTSTSIDRNEFTIGWISALPLEATAAELVLTENYGQPNSVPAGDGNQYTLGKIGNHKVVIAIMPKGVYGKTTAKGVAEHMIRTFQNVKVGLMVGVGGGAPSSKDVRLGDVVVSAPGDGQGGVFHYDAVKNIQDKGLKHNAHLNSPPEFLGKAVSKLESLHMDSPQAIDKIIDKTIDEEILPKQSPEFQGKWRRPGPNADVLFRSTVVHNKGTRLNFWVVLGVILFLLGLVLSHFRMCSSLFTSVSLAAGFLLILFELTVRDKFFASPDISDEDVCEKICGTSNPKCVVKRPPRNDSKVPLIHYGLIGSADQLMKNAMDRDCLAKRFNIICFEMEAAGLMNTFPCLAVRGICDYSDSHKNKKWQKYAALAAAVYARKLIEQLPATEVENQRTLLESWSHS